MIFILTKENALMETRVAVLAIIVRGGSSVQPLNELLHQYGQYIIGRMGVPYRERGLSIIALLVDGSTDALGAMTGKLGNIPGVKVRSVLLTAAGQELSPKEDS
jgi:putative iron-only hydrogenase system regulator